MKRGWEMHYGPIACPCGHWAVRDVMRPTLTGKVLHYKGAIVAPAFAGATAFFAERFFWG